MCVSVWGPRGSILSSLSNNGPVSMAGQWAIWFISRALCVRGNGPSACQPLVSRRFVPARGSTAVHHAAPCLAPLSRSPAPDARPAGIRPLVRELGRLSLCPLFVIRASPENAIYKKREGADEKGDGRGKKINPDPGRRPQWEGKERRSAWK